VMNFHALSEKDISEMESEFHLCLKNINYLSLNSPSKSGNLKLLCIPLPF